jgi:hypothetical protein
MAGNRLHEAVCAAAGWKPYCDRCGGKLTRVPQLGGASSQCLNQECIDKRMEEINAEAKREYWERWAEGD